jgi:hypothetical protein
MIKILKKLQQSKGLKSHRERERVKKKIVPVRNGNVYFPGSSALDLVALL